MNIFITVSISVIVSAIICFLLFRKFSHIVVGMIDEYQREHLEEITKITLDAMNEIKTIGKF